MEKQLSTIGYWLGLICTVLAYGKLGRHANATPTPAGASSVVGGPRHPESLASRAGARVDG